MKILSKLVCVAVMPMLILNACSNAEIIDRITVKSLPAQADKSVTNSIPSGIFIFI